MRLPQLSLLHKHRSSAFRPAFPKEREAVEGSATSAKPTPPRIATVSQALALAIIPYCTVLTGRMHAFVALPFTIYRAWTWLSPMPVLAVPLPKSFGTFGVLSTQDWSGKQVNLSRDVHFESVAPRESARQVSLQTGDRNDVFLTGKLEAFYQGHHTASIRQATG